jgi:hypothetical protein
MSDAARRVEEILEKLVRDVEVSVHALYRGDVRQQTMKSKGETFRKEARDALLPLVGVAPSIGDARPSGAAGALLSGDEVAAITRCIMGWLPMGPPSAASPQSRCVTAAKELAPSWGEREKARLAIRRAAS